MDINKTLKKRNISFILNLLLTLVSILIVLLLMISSPFLNSVLDGYKRIVFLSIVIFGVVLNFAYLMCYLFVRISIKEACFLSVIGSKKEKDFYDTFKNDEDNEIKNSELNNELSVDSNNEIDIEEINLTIASSEEKNKEVEINDLKDEKFHLSKKGKLFFVLSNIADLYTVVAVAFLVVALVFCFVLFPATVQGDCMQPLLYGQTYSYSGDKIIALKNKKFGVGDVVVFEYDYDIQAVGSVKDNELLVKRIVASPGQRFECIEGKIYIDGKELEEDYVKMGYGTGVSYSLNKIIRYNSNFEKIDFNDDNIVPEGYYVLLGDNRKVANDSHYFGLVREDQICGVVEYYKNNSGWNKIY